MNYRLKIDYYDGRVTLKKGLILEKDVDRYVYPCSFSNWTNHVSKDFVEKNPDIFEPVEHKRWKPHDLQRFWYIISTGEVVSGRWIGINRYDLYYNFCNCFPTEEAAIKGRDAVKKLLLSMSEEK